MDAHNRGTYASIRQALLEMGALRGTSIQRRTWNSGLAQIEAAALLDSVAESLSHGAAILRTSSKPEEVLRQQCRDLNQALDEIFRVYGVK